MITKEQKIEMFSMRLDGMTFEEIGNHFGVSKQYVNEIFEMVSENQKKKNTCSNRNYISKFRKMDN